MIQVCLVCLAVCGLFAVSGAHAVAADDQPEVVFETNMGNITIALDAAKAPITVKNFLEYVDSGHYNGTIFHRVINGFMIQGGGFTEAMVEKPTKASIKNESYNGLINQRGTIAMARTPEPDSASAQFFINLKDNSFLDRANAQDRVGYAVFGRVVEGMDVVDKIARVQTGIKRGHQDVPVQPVIVKTAKRKTKS